jgi:hypothetical protein
MFRTLSRMTIVVFVIFLAGESAIGLMAAGQASTLAPADAKAWLGDWNLTVEGGRGPQERTLTIKDMAGKVVATMGGGRGGPIEITNISKKGDDLVMQFKQQGRGGEVDVTLTLSMQPDGTLKVSQILGANTQSGTGKKKV